jgi:hypothetical protein
MSNKKDRRLDITESGEQEKLPGTDVPRVVGPVELAVEKSILDAAENDELQMLDAGASALALQLARTVDWCHTNAEPHTLTLASARLSELLTKLKLEPASREPKGGKHGGINWDAELANLAAAEEGTGSPPNRDVKKS